MGILDDLKKQAEATQARQASATQATQSRTAEVEAALLPKMRALYEYFSEFQNYVQVVKPEVDVSLELLEIGEVTGLGQSDYKLSTDDREKITSFNFRFVRSKKGVTQVKMGDNKAAGAYRDYIRDNRLRAKVRPGNKGGSVFIVDMAIPVSISFGMDIDHAKLILRLRNFDTLGVSRHGLSLEQVNDKFLDELAKAILRKPSRLDQLLGNALSNTSRMKIQQQLKAAIRQSEIEAQLSKKSSKESISKKFSRTFLGHKDS